MELDFTAITENMDLNDTQEPPVAEQAASLAAQSQQERKKLERARQAYSEYQHNIKTSEALRAEILKGLASGESHAVILEKAIRCIGCMTDDKVFAAQSAKMLK